MVDQMELENLKEKIVEIIGQRIELRKTSANWVARCPFHDDRTPSFTIKKNRWRCWVCNEGGDTLDFIQKFHGTDFFGALTILGVKTDGGNKEVWEHIKQALDEVEQDKNYLIEQLGKKEDDLCFLSRQVTWLIAKMPPLERRRQWYASEHWLEQEFQEIEYQREQIHAIARKHREGIFKWAQQLKAS